jgi:ribonuclease E
MPQMAAQPEVVVQVAPAIPEPVAERVVEHVPAAPVVVAPAIPVAREPIVLPSDLEQVETDAEKLRVAASKIELPPPPRTPRVRPPLPPISNEPLVQVETRK